RRHAARARAIAVVVAVAVLAAGFVVLSRLHATPGQAGSAEGLTTTSRRVRLQSDCEGAIAEWILFLPDRSPGVFLETFTQIVTRAHPAIRFQIAYASRDAADALKARLRKRGFTDLDRVAWKQAPGQLWPWVRDQFLVGTDVHGRSVVYAHHPDYYARFTTPDGIDGNVSRAMVEILARTRPVRTRARIEGGAIVADGDRAFLNPEVVATAMRAGDFPDRSSYLDYLGDLYDLEVEVVRTRPGGAPGHCDLFMVPAHSNHIVLGDPRLGVELLGTAPRDEIARFEARLHKVIDASPPDDLLRSLTNAPIEQHLLLENGRERAIRDYEAVAEQCRRLGYTVVRVPLLMLDADRSGAPIALSYTNVIQDERDGRHTVYLPTYGLPTLARAAAQTWRGIGYRVVEIDTLGPGLNGGGLRCLSHVFRTGSRRATPRGPRPRTGPARH
ncbi:MAG: hypothetical protein ACYTG6_06865, partial [Planctomycetota bacterium]